jgi:predicted dithiol-disulfide oxidoreductase (DUF899 family)
LPPGGPVIGDYRFEGEKGAVDFEGLFGGKETLAIYSYMPEGRGADWYPKLEYDA